MKLKKSFFVECIALILVLVMGTILFNSGNEISTDREELSFNISEFMQIGQSIVLDEFKMHSYLDSDQLFEISISQRTIYLTFDDGPSSNVTPQILDILKKYNIKATFFINDFRGREDIVRRTIAEGHTLGNHTLSHYYPWIYRSEENFIRNVDALNRKVKNEFGIDMDLLRFPGGTSNTVSRRYNRGIMTRLVPVMKERGFSIFDWNAVNNSDIRGTDAEEAFKQAISTGRDRDFIILLMHDADHHQVTADALEKIIKYYIDLGYRFNVLSSDVPMLIKPVAN